MNFNLSSISEQRIVVFMLVLNLIDVDNLPTGIENFVGEIFVHLGSEGTGGGQVSLVDDHCRCQCRFEVILLHYGIGSSTTN